MSAMMIDSVKFLEPSLIVLPALAGSAVIFPLAAGVEVAGCADELVSDDEDEEELSEPHAVTPNAAAAVIAARAAWTRRPL